MSALFLAVKGFSVLANLIGSGVGELDNSVIICNGSWLVVTTWSAFPLCYIGVTKDAFCTSASSFYEDTSSTSSSSSTISTFTSGLWMSGRKSPGFGVDRFLAVLLTSDKGYKLPTVWSKFKAFQSLCVFSVVTSGRGRVCEHFFFINKVSIGNTTSNVTMTAMRAITVLQG